MRVSEEWSGSRSFRPKLANHRIARLSLAHQPSVVDDAEQKPRQHQPHRGLGVDPGPPDARGVEIGHLVAQPAEIEHPIDPRKDVVVGNEVPKRAAHEELELVALLASKHRHLPVDRRHS